MSVKSNSKSVKSNGEVSEIEKADPFSLHNLKNESSKSLLMIVVEKKDKSGVGWRNS